MFLIHLAGVCGGAEGVEKIPLFENGLNEWLLGWIPNAIHFVFFPLQPNHKLTIVFLRGGVMKGRGGERLAFVLCNEREVVGTLLKYRILWMSNYIRNSVWIFCFYFFSPARIFGVNVVRKLSTSQLKSGIRSLSLLCFENGERRGWKEVLLGSDWGVLCRCMRKNFGYYMKYLALRSWSCNPGPVGSIFCKGGSSRAQLCIFVRYVRRERGLIICDT